MASHVDSVCRVDGFLGFLTNAIANAVANAIANAVGSNSYWSYSKLSYH